MVPENPRANFKNFVKRFSPIDHHKANIVEAGLVWVLNPAKNPADIAAMRTLAENVPPEMAAEITAWLDYIEAHPDRELGDFGTKCLPHITHPAVVEYAKKKLADG